MVSSPHEALHRIFQKDPALLTRALQQVLDVPFPEPREFAAVNVDLTEIEPVERRVDTLLRAETDEGTYLLVVESQGKKGEGKRRSWPYYLSYLYTKYHCDPVLIVITQSAATARWAAQPIHLGVRGRPSLTVRPLVLGPDNVPVIADERAAGQDVPLAVLSAMTHGKGRKAAAILESLVAALRTIDAESAAVFVQFVDSCLTDPEALQIWRDLMTDTQYFFRHPLAEQTREEGREEGRVEAQAEMIFKTLEWRGIPVSDEGPRASHRLQGQCPAHGLGPTGYRGDRYRGSFPGHLNVAWKRRSDACPENVRPLSEGPPACCRRALTPSSCDTSSWEL